jgi:OHCU decarboxylase
MLEKLTIDEVNGLSRGEFVGRFGTLFEHSPWIAEQAWQERPFDGPHHLYGAFLRAMYSAPDRLQLALIKAHPELAGKAAIAGELTTDSAWEQASAGLDRLSAEEYVRFMDLNDAYRDKFGFPMVICVREHTKQTILAQAETRLGNPQETEIRTALNEIAKIADFRLRDLLVASLGEHVEDEGVRVQAEFDRVESAAERVGGD